MVAVSSSWLRDDLQTHLGVAPEKISVVPLAPSTAAYAKPDSDALSAISMRLELPSDFAFYPAQTWPHKNHIGLIRATAKLRGDQGIVVPLVFSGRKTDHHAELQREIRALGMDGQVRFFGFVSPEELQSLYRLCRCVVIPTRFEAASFPLWDSFLAGAPTACSNVTSLPRQAGDASLLFNPGDINEIASCLGRLWLEEEPRDTLSARGRESVERFTWQRTALLFRAHYRKITGRGLTEEDQSLLAAEPLLQALMA